MSSSFVYIDQVTATYRITKQSSNKNLFYPLFAVAIEMLPPMRRHFSLKRRRFIDISDIITYPAVNFNMLRKNFTNLTQKSRIVGSDFLHAILYSHFAQIASAMRKPSQALLVMPPL